MAHTPKNKSLESRTARLAVKKGARAWQRITAGLSIGYRKPKEGSGSWTARIMLNDGSEPWIGLGSADDNADADGVDVLSYDQAVEKAREVAKEARRPTHLKQGPVTIQKTLEAYLKAYEERGGKSLRETRTTIDAHITPHLGSIEVADLTPEMIKNWQTKLATTPPRKSSRAKGVRLDETWEPTPENIRARQATVNRIRTVLIAALNHGFETGLVADDIAWRKTKPFKSADKPIVQFLEPGDCVRLLNACEDDFRLVVRAGLLTGARYGELVKAKVSDVQISKGGLWLHETKSGQSRFVHLNDEGLRFFESLIEGRKHDECALLRADGKPWGDSHQSRRFGAALKKAGLPEHFSFHDLRHSFASMLIQSGVPIEVIADALGHADTRITIRHYAHLSDKVRKEAVSRLPSFGIEESLESNVVSIKPAKKA